MTNLSSYPVPIFSLKKSERNIKESISRIATGINVLSGNNASRHILGTTLEADGKSYIQATNSIDSGLSLLNLVESALTELDSLASRLKELGQQATLSTNTTEDSNSLDKIKLTVK